VESPPNATEVAGRLLALRCVVTHALSPPERPAVVNSSPIFPYLSPRERKFVTTTKRTMSGRQHLDALWRLEAAQVLTWALRLIPELPAPDEQADLGLLELEILNHPAPFLSSAVLRTQTEIYHARDVAELWHWRSRTEQLIREGERFPANEDMIRRGLRSYRDIVRMAVTAVYERGDVHPVIGDDFAVKGKSYAELSAEEWSEIGSISIERHRALNWLCGYSPHNDWDDTPTDT
jgi:Domain of unknown function (DUF4272)